MAEQEKPRNPLKEQEILKSVMETEKGLSFAAGIEYTGLTKEGIMLAEKLSVDHSIPQIEEIMEGVKIGIKKLRESKEFAQKEQLHFASLFENAFEK